MIQDTLSKLYAPAITLLLAWGGLTNSISLRDRAIALLLAGWGTYSLLHQTGLL